MVKALTKILTILKVTRTGTLQREIHFSRAFFSDIGSIERFCVKIHTILF